MHRYETKPLLSPSPKNIYTHDKKRPCLNIDDAYRFQP